MIRTATIKGQKVRINQQDVLGIGGEATVVKDGHRAIKIYHKIDAKRIAKLKDFHRSNFSLPKNVCAIQDLAYDSTGYKLVGFTMPLIPPGREVVQELARKSFRKAHPKCNSKFIADLFIHAYKTTEALHKEGIIIGDYNDLNLLFNTTKPQMVFIDVDSYQFGKHPCMVGTEHFLDPNLYGINLADKPYFQEENDWYSFWAMLIKSLIMCHPYGGIHHEYRTLPLRAQARITALDNGVVYPKASYSPELLDDAIMKVMDLIFKQGKRYKPEIGILEEFKDSLVECSSCGVMYPAEKSNCPQCTKINIQQIQRKIRVVAKPGKRTINCEEMISTDGNFIWHKLYENTIFALSLKNDTYTLHRKTPNKEAEEVWQTTSKNPIRIGIFGENYLVTNDGSEEIRIRNLNTSEVITRTCGIYQGIRTFGCTKEHLFRMENGWMYRGNIDAITGYTETQIINLMDDQTGFICSSDGETVFGCQRFFNNYQFFLHRYDRIKRGEFFEVPISFSDTSESILRISVRFHGPNVLCLIKTEIAGRTYTRVYVIHNDQILSQYRVESLSSDTHRNIHGKAFVCPNRTKGIILHPTDDGVVQEIVGDNCAGKLALLAETEQFVSESDSLVNYKNGILVVGDKLINYLTIS